MRQAPRGTCCVGVVGDGELKLTEDSDLERIVFAIGEI